MFLFFFYFNFFLLFLIITFGQMKLNNDYWTNEMLIILERNSVARVLINEVNKVNTCDLFHPSKSFSVTFIWVWLALKSKKKLLVLWLQAKDWRIICFLSKYVYEIQWCFPVFLKKFFFLYIAQSHNNYCFENYFTVYFSGFLLTFHITQK